MELGGVQIGVLGNGGCRGAKGGRGNERHEVAGTIGQEDRKRPLQGPNDRAVYVGVLARSIDLPVVSPCQRVDVERCDGSHVRDDQCAKSTPASTGYRSPPRKELSGCCGAGGLSEGPGDHLAEPQTKDVHKRAILDDRRRSYSHKGCRGRGRG